MQKGALNGMDKLLERIFSLLPNVRLLLATLIGSNPFYGGLRHAAYNSGLRDFVIQYAAAGRNIELVDMAMESGIGEYCGDENCCPLAIHPKVLGYAKMAKVWHRHLMNTTTTTLSSIAAVSSVHNNNEFSVQRTGSTEPLMPIIWNTSEVKVLV
jgi:hypothetical protein